MKREKKSEPGWRRTKIGDISASPYSRETLQRLVALLPLPDDADIESLHRELQDWARMYLHAKQNVDYAPRPSEIREELNKLRKQAARLRDTLSALDDESRSYLDRAGVNESMENTLDPMEASSTALALSQIEGLIGLIDSSFEAIPEGGPRKVARPILVHALAKLWFQFIGKPPTRSHNPYAPASEQEYGEFRDFVIAAIEALDPEDIKRGLDDNIREATDKIREAIRANRDMG